MSDFGSMSRESKKDKLRRQIVRPQQPAWNADPEEGPQPGFTSPVAPGDPGAASDRRRRGSLDLLPAQLPLFRL